MHNLKTTWCICLLTLLIASPGFCLDIQLKEQALVTEPIVRLGDIASITPEGPKARQLAERQVSRAPAPGKSKIIQSRSLISSLRHLQGAENFKWTGPENITIRRQGIEISREGLKQIIADFLQQNLGNIPDIELRFTSVRAPESIILPTGDIQHTVTPSKPGIIGSSSFSIIFQVDGKTVKNCTVRGKLEVIAEVATARVNMRRGNIITADQLKMTRLDISKFDKPYPAIDLVVGMQAKRTIRAGRVIDRQNVELPPIIKKGQPVKIVASRGSLQVSANGVAIMDGRLGDFIRVKNINSSKLIYCKVDSSGIVSVEF